MIKQSKLTNNPINPSNPNLVPTTTKITLIRPINKAKFIKKDPKLVYIRCPRIQWMALFTSTSTLTQDQQSHISNPNHLLFLTCNNLNKFRKVACDQCTFEQNVPGNTQVYACCMCNNMNECYPLYGLFICGRCQTSVCYPYGTSELIKCTRCFTVNKVPIEPQKKYIDSKIKENKP